MEKKEGKMVELGRFCDSLLSQAEFLGLPIH